jgi:hypothetical protein
MTKQLRDSLHIGNKKAFGQWKLIWIDKDGKIFCETISQALAAGLIASGMPTEG